MRRVKRLIRNTAATIVGRCALARPLARVFGGRAAILAYHRVIDARHQDADMIELGMHLTREAFAQHLELLGRRFRVVPLAELVRNRREGEPIPWGTVVITFDDGWLDTYEVAYPLLRSAGLPATVFLPTNLIGRKHRFWFSRVAEASRIIWDRRGEMEALIRRAGTPSDAMFVAELLANRPSRAEWFHKTLSICRALGPGRREAVADFLERITETTFEDRAEMIDWDQARTMARDVFEIGSHTAEHMRLASVDGQTVRRELEESRRVIAEEIGVSPFSLCYPHGDFDEQCRLAAEQSGYACALTGHPGFADDPTDLYALPRFTMHQTVAANADGLELFLSGLGQFRSAADTLPPSEAGIDPASGPAAASSDP